MSAQATPAANPPKEKPKERRGIVIVAVLVVVAALSLAGYQFSDLMTSEYRASDNSHRMAQARNFADSGVHYAAALLSNPDNYNNVLFGNPFNNPDAFRDVAIQGPDGKVIGRFTVLAPPEDGATEHHYGVADECGKINPNAMMRLDPTGAGLGEVLKKLPNMTDEIAANIVAWMGGTAGLEAGGAGNDYYTTLTPPYRSKNGFLDSIDELLLVKGVTRELLYGSDSNRNGLDDEQAANVGRGLAAYLTVHSREQNRDIEGYLPTFLGNTDVQPMAEMLFEKGVDENLIKFIVLYRKYGPASKSGGSQSALQTLASALSGASTTNKNTYNEQDLSEYPAEKIAAILTGKKIESIFKLVNVSVNIDTGKKNKEGGKIYDVYQSPLNDPANQRALLPLLFNLAGVTEETDLPPRVNVATAPPEVLAAIGFDEADVTKIITARPAPGQPLDDIHYTPAWLVSDAQLDPVKLAAMEKLITSRSQVYRFQVIGHFDGGKGPALRVEAVIDTNNGRPRILMSRDLSELGRGLSLTPNQ
jgi:hypothetical protein